MRFRQYLAAGLVAALWWAVPAVAQTRGGTVTVGVEQDIPGFDPIVVGVYDTGALAAAALLFDTMTRIDDNGQVQPRLALSWTNAPDFKTWTFKLRPGVKFHDGTSFNAQAVVANFRRMVDPDNRCACAFYLGAIQRVEAADELTVVYRLRNPVVELPALMSPPTVTNVMHSPTAMQTSGKDYNRKPVGTGPFALKSWVSGGELVLERNASYWNTGKPYLERVQVRPMRDPGARFAALRAGNVDAIWHDVPDDLVKAKTLPGLKVNIYAGSGVSGPVFNTTKPPLNDVRVRQALKMALDMPALATGFSSGLWTPAKDPYGPGSSVQCKDSGDLGHDLAKARALLKDYGKPVNVRYMVTAEPRGRALGQIFQEMWKAVGANVTLDEVDQTTFVNRALVRDFEIGGWRIIDLADPDPQMVANFKTGSMVNIAGYSNAEVDSLLEQARQTADKAQRSTLYCKVAQQLNKDVPWVWGMTNKYFNIHKVGLAGIHKQYSDVLDVSDAWWQGASK